MSNKTQIGNILLTNWRLAFAHGLWSAGLVSGQTTGKPAFSCSLLAPPNHPDIPLVQRAMIAACRAKWGDKGDDVYKALMAGGRICLRDGNTKPNVEGFPGAWFVSARSPTQPIVIDENRNPVDESSGKIYSGCYVNARVNIWAQQNQHGRRVNAQLAGIQFYRDGEPFSAGGAASPDEFGEVEQHAQAGAEFGDLIGMQPQGGAPLGPQISPQYALLPGQQQQYPQQPVYPQQPGQQQYPQQPGQQQYPQQPVYPQQLSPQQPPFGPPQPFNPLQK